ncbi:MAG: cobalamin biosynthesis protein P47K, partial [Candidatus Hydrogenedentes bacterium]|nr:cobalamin biosynthesis protein P47K [Candidatus Hydrogenedentota bacterium]
EEIPAGCFCVHFEKLIEASGRLADGLKPDIILAEPVGSCTDLVNAVITPLKSLYTDQFVVAPYVALLDPIHALEALSVTGATGFSRKVTYIYKMQQNEADIVAINKTDQLDPAKLERVEALVAQNFPRATCLSVSAITGAGFDRLVSLLDEPGEAGLNPAQVDYKRYTEGEIALGWLNAQVAVSAAAPWDGNAFLMVVAQSVRAGLIMGGAQIAHFKMRLVDEQGREAALHATSNEGTLALAQCIDTPVSTGRLVVNLRAEGNPETLQQSVETALKAVEMALEVDCSIERCEAFAPNPPSPPPPERNRIRT